MINLTKDGLGKIPGGVEWEKRIAHVSKGYRMLGLLSFHKKLRRSSSGSTIKKPSYY